MPTWFVPISTKSSSEARFVHKYSIKNKKTTKRRVLTALARKVAKAKKAGKSHITGWKKVRAVGNSWGGCIAELHVPVNAAMRCPANKKCRASRVKVIAIYSWGYNKPYLSLNDRVIKDKLPDSVVCRPYNKSTRSTRYEVGKWVRPEEKFEKNNVECASGIHFFLTAEEAMNW